MVTPTPAPTPVPPPVSPGQKWYASASFLTWAITSLIGIAGGIATEIGHPFDSSAANAIATSVAWTIAGIITTVYVHGQATLARQAHAQVFQAREAALDRAYQYGIIQGTVGNTL